MPNIPTNITPINTIKISAIFYSITNYTTLDFTYRKSGDGNPTSSSMNTNPVPKSLYASFNLNHSMELIKEFKTRIVGIATNSVLSSLSFNSIASHMLTPTSNTIKMQSNRRHKIEPTRP